MFPARPTATTVSAAVSRASPSGFRLGSANDPLDEGCGGVPVRRGTKHRRRLTARLCTPLVDAEYASESGHCGPAVEGGTFTQAANHLVHGGNVGTWALGQRAHGRGKKRVTPGPTGTGVGLDAGRQLRRSSGIAGSQRQPGPGQCPAMALVPGHRPRPLGDRSQALEGLVGIGPRLLVPAPVVGHPAGHLESTSAPTESDGGGGVLGRFLQTPQSHPHPRPGHQGVDGIADGQGGGKVLFGAGEIEAAEPGRSFAFAVGKQAKPDTIWRYRFDPAGDEVTVTESFELVKPLGFFSRLLTRVTTGVKDREADLTAGARATLAALKKAAEPTDR